MYAHSLERIIPGFTQEAPIERMITREKLSFMTETGAVTVDFQNAAAQNPDETSWSVLRKTGPMAG